MIELNHWEKDESVEITIAVFDAIFYHYLPSTNNNKQRSKNKRQQATTALFLCNGLKMIWKKEKKTEKEKVVDGATPLSDNTSHRAY